MYDDIKIITNEETIKYLNLYKETNIKKYRDEIVIGHLHLVKFIVNKYFKNNMYNSFEDLVEVGIIGLIRAIKYYNPAKKAKFSTFAYLCIKSEILRLVYADQRRISCVSLDKNYDNISLIPSDIDLENDYIETEILEFLKDNIELLSSSDQELIRDLYGFKDKRLSLTDIANKNNCSRKVITRRVNKIISKLQLQLLESGYVDKIKSLHI